MSPILSPGILRCLLLKPPMYDTTSEGEDEGRGRERGRDGEREKEEEKEN